MLTKRGLDFKLSDLAPLSAGLPAGARQASLGAIALDLVEGKAPKWLRLLSPGDNATRDGRGPFKVDPAKVVALSRQLAAGLEPVIDYEHQFDNAPKNGQPAPASGWIERFADAGPNGEPGVWALLRWNERARDHIERGEYRYLSPVLAHDKSGVVLAVVRAALTNYPALANAPALFSVSPSPQKEVKTMDLVKILGALFGAPNADEAAIVTLATNLKAQLAALCTTLGVDLVALSAMTGAQLVGAIQAKGVDPAAFVPIATHNAVTGELAALRTAEIGRLVEGAIKDGKATPAQKGWLEDLGKSDLAKLTAFLGTAPQIIKPGQEQQQQQPPGTGEVKLSDADLAMCRALNINPDDFKKERAVELAELRATTGKEG